MIAGANPRWKCGARQGSREPNTYKILLTVHDAALLAQHISELAIVVAVEDILPGTRTKQTKLWNQYQHPPHTLPSTAWSPAAAPPFAQSFAQLHPASPHSSRPRSQGNRYLISCVYLISTEPKEPENGRFWYVDLMPLSMRC